MAFYARYTVKACAYSCVG